MNTRCLLLSLFYQSPLVSSRTRFHARPECIIPISTSHWNRRCFEYCFVIVRMHFYHGICLSEHLECIYGMSVWRSNQHIIQTQWEKIEIMDKVCEKFGLFLIFCLPYFRQYTQNTREAFMYYHQNFDEYDCQLHAMLLTASVAFVLKNEKK